MPGCRGKAPSPIRAFCLEQLEEFGGMECAEVSGWPEGKTAQQVAQAMRDAVWARGQRGRVRVARRGGRVFLVRERRR